MVRVLGGDGEVEVGGEAGGGGEAEGGDAEGRDGEGRAVGAVEEPEGGGRDGDDEE